MTDSFSFSKFASAALIGSVITVSLLGCQPNTETAATSEEVTPADSHAEHDHAGHTHEESSHEENGHDEHDHMEHNHEEHAHAGHDHSGHDHESADMTAYTCQPEQTIQAHYDSTADKQAKTAHLLIDGIEYDLEAVATPDSGNTTYETDIGISDDMGMRWQITSLDGDQAVLSQKSLGSSATQSDEAVLFDCRLADSEY